MIHKWKFAFVLLIIFLSICMLCACIPDRTIEGVILLPRNSSEVGNPIRIGEYRLTGRKKFSYGDMYETRLGEQEGLLDLYRNSEYFVAEGKFFLSDYFQRLEGELYLDQDAIWLCDGSSVWVCQAYGNKRVRVVRLDNVEFNTEDMALEACLSNVFFTSFDYYLQFDVAYASPFSWSQLKAFFPSGRVNEEEKSIAIECKYKLEGDTWQNNGIGKTKMYFNESGNTIEVSSDYTPASQFGW